MSAEQIENYLVDMYCSKCYRFKQCHDNCENCDKINEAAERLMRKRR